MKTLFKGEVSGQRGEPDPAPSSQPRLLSLRAAVIFVTSCVVGAAAGFLTMAVQPNAATAIIAGGAAWAGTVRFLDAIIGQP